MTSRNKAIFAVLLATVLPLSSIGKACESGQGVSAIDSLGHICMQIGKELTALDPKDIESILGTGESNLSQSIRQGLRDNYVNNIRANQQEGRALQDHAVTQKERARRFVTRSKASAGTRLKNINISEIKAGDPTEKLSEYEKALLQPANCQTPAGSGGAKDLPVDLQVSFVQQNGSRLAEYSDLLINGSGVSDFCKAHIGTFTTSDAILKPKTIRPSIPASPLSQTHFQTSIESAEGKLVRQISNKFQVEWLERDGFVYAERHEKASYLSGVALLQAADESFYSGELGAGHGYAQAAEMMLNISKGFVEGFFVDGAFAFIEAIPVLAEAGLKLSLNMARAQVDPSFAREYYLELANQAIVTVPKIKDAVVQGLIADYDTLVNGDSYSRSRMVGRYAFDAVTDFLTGGGMKAANTGKSIVMKSARLAQKQALKDLATEAFDSSSYYDAIRGAALTPKLQLQRLDKKAKRFRRIHESLANVNSGLTPRSKNYLANLIANGGRYGLPHFTDEQLVHLVNRYHDFELVLSEIQRSSFTGRVHRMIPKQIELDSGDLLNLSPQKVFEMHSSSVLANGRASMPGVSALYTTIGKDFTDIRGTLMKEVNAKDLKKWWKGTTILETDNIIDLSPTTAVGRDNLRRLNLSAKDLLQAEDMLLPQAIGHLVNKLDVDGLILPSRHNPDVSNLIIF